MFPLLSKKQLQRIKDPGKKFFYELIMPPKSRNGLLGGLVSATS
jgi:hypothetical protein